MLPEGTCELYGFFSIGHRRHYCYNAARCEVEIEGESYLSCFECRDELYDLGVLKPPSAA
jgi:hypothetical protein